jgi:large subunit ribosomal protein L18
MSHNEVKKQYQQRKKRALRVRRKLRGSSATPRMSVVKSNCHIQVQLIDDEKGITLGGIATYSKELAQTEFGKKNKKSARKLGERIAEIAKEKNVQVVIFDRGPFNYHGILAELAEGARAGGLRF